MAKTGIQIIDNSMGRVKRIGARSKFTNVEDSEELRDRISDSLLGATLPALRGNAVSRRQLTSLPYLPPFHHSSSSKIPGLFSLQILQEHALLKRRKQDAAGR